MLADKTLLGGTLLLTFVSGSFVGYATNEMNAPRPASPFAAAEVYRPELTKLEEAGYDAASLREAQDIYQDYLDAYSTWWTQFLETYKDNLQIIDDKLQERLKALEERVRAKGGDTEKR